MEAPEPLAVAAGEAGPFGQRIGDQAGEEGGVAAVPAPVAVVARPRSRLEHQRAEEVRRRDDRRPVSLGDGQSDGSFQRLVTALDADRLPARRRAQRPPRRGVVGCQHVDDGTVLRPAEAVHLAGAVGLGLQVQLPHRLHAPAQSRWVGEQIGQDVDVLAGSRGRPPGRQSVQHHHLAAHEDPARRVQPAGQVEDEVPQPVERSGERR
ncbi:hypothetical protein [Geodermatophilus sp. SYSU D00696]